MSDAVFQAPNSWRTLNRRSPALHCLLPRELRCGLLLSNPMLNWRTVVLWIALSQLVGCAGDGSEATADVSNVAVVARHRAVLDGLVGRG